MSEDRTSERVDEMTYRLQTVADILWYERCPPIAEHRLRRLLQAVFGCRVGGIRERA